MKSFFVLLLALQACLAADFNTGQAARVVIGQSTFTRSSPTSSATTLGGVGGLAYANNTLFVADSNRFGASPVNNRVLLFQNLSGTLPAPTDPLDFGGDLPYISSSCPVCRGLANVVLGQPDFTTTKQGLTQTGLRGSTAVASDGVMIAVADTDNNRILIWRTIPSSNAAPADVVIGQPDFTHSATSVPPNSKSLRGPQGVWIQGGKLYVADTQDNRILIYNSIPTANGAAADVVLGQPDSNTFVEPDLTKTAVNPKPNNMQNPVAVSSDGQRLYVTDLGLNRVLIWNAIPTQNGASADIAIGQKDFTSGFPNDSTNLCASNGTGTDSKPTYPARCATTLSFPRFALSDGKRLFIADGGNDRVLIYSTIPASTGQAADIILGQRDATSDFSSDDTDSLQTPSSLAWDGTNLFVSDSFNRRVLGYSVGEQKIPVAGVRNAASREIFALGTVTVGGTIKENDTITVTIGAPDSNGTAQNKDYKYTIVKDDTFGNVVQKLVDMINSAPDPNVVARPNPVTQGIVLTAKKGGQPGGGITYSVTLSASAVIAATTGGATLSIDLEDAARIAPGSLVTISGTNLSDDTATADLSRPDRSFAPTELVGTQVYFDGIRAPLVYVSPTQINAEIPFEVQDRTSVSAFVRTVHADGSVTVTTPVAVSIVGENPGIFAEEGTDPRPGLVFHAFTNDTGAVSVDGSIKAGDVATVTIEDRPYSYTVVATDTLDTVRQGLIALINANPDEKVVASATNTFTRILLTAKVANTRGLLYSASVNTGASIILTALTPNLCCGNAAGGRVTDANPAIPGEVLYIYATGLGVTNPSVETGRIFDGSTNNPPVTPVDSILVGGKTANIVNVTLVPGQIGVYQVQFQLNSDLPTDPQTQMTIAQQAFVSNVVTLSVFTQPTPASFTFTAQPSDTKVNAVISPAIEVQAADSAGSPLAGVLVTISLSTNPSSATLHGTLKKVTDANGKASFGDLSIDAAGNGYQLTVTDYKAAATAASSAFNIVP